jgi:hypothetical protein
MSTAPAGNIMAVDADPASAAVDNTTTQALGAPFDVAINMASAMNEYNVYQFTLQWDSSVLSFVSATHLNPDGFTACFDFSPTASTVATACGRPAGPSTFLAATDRVSLQCKTEGVSALHLATSAEDPGFGTMTITDGGMIATDTVDASVTCR